MARWIAVVAVLGLGVVAAARLPLRYAVEAVTPEVSVALHVPGAAMEDPVAMTRRWVVPVESAARSLGGVRAIRGQVSANSARFTIRYEPRFDARARTAALLSALSGLRRELPPGASLNAWPGAVNANAPSALLVAFGSGRRLGSAVADALRGTRGVRDVTLYGAPEREIVVALNGEEPAADDVRARIEESLSRKMLGVRSERSRSSTVVSAESSGGRAFQPVLTEIVRNTIIPRETGSVQLGSIATITRRESEPQSLFRYAGKPAIVLNVYRDSDVSLLEFDRLLRDRIAAINAGGTGIEVVYSEAEPLRELLRRAAIASFAALLFLAVFGALACGARGIVPVAVMLPLSVAAALNAYWIAGIELDAQTIVAIGAACAMSVTIGLLRLTAGAGRSAPASLSIAWASAAIPLAAARIGPESLWSSLAHPSLAFFAAAVAASSVALLVPFPPMRLRRLRPMTHRLRGMLRESPAVLLAVLTVTYILFTLFGRALDPREARDQSAVRYLYVNVSLAPGTTLAQTDAMIRRAEARMAKIEGIARTWSTVFSGNATIVVDLGRGARRPDLARAVETQIRYRARLPFAATTIERERVRGGGFAAVRDIEDRPHADERGFEYGVVLQSTDADALRVAFDRIVSRVRRAGIAERYVRASLGRESARLTLVPRAGTSQQQAVALARTLRERSLPPEGTTLPFTESETLVVRGPRSPQSDEDVPQRADLLEVPVHTSAGIVVPSAVLSVEQGRVAQTLTRQAGRFVLPIDIGIPGYEAQRARKDLDRALGVLALPPGSLLERPQLAGWRFSVEKLKVLALAALLPVLLFVLAAFFLDSFVVAAAVLIPALIAVALSLPLLALSGFVMDEVAVFALAAALCAALPAPLLIASGLPKHPSVFAAYRTFRGSVASVAAGGLFAAILFGAAAFGADPSEAGWKYPVAMMAIAASVTLLATALVPAASLIAAREARRRLSPSARAARNPENWLNPETLPVLDIHKVSKRYASGHRALSSVSFELRPGIIGLLGPNGAGKTTLLRIMTRLLEPTRGQIVFQGVALSPENAVAYRRQIGFLPQEFNGYSGMTAEEFLDYWAVEQGVVDAAKRREEIETLLAVVGLEADAGRKVRDFSGGMRQRVGIARALIGSPPVLVLDEPTTGLDIEARAHFRGLLMMIARHRIVVVSTHIGSDLEATASRILLLHRGELRFDGTPDALVDRARGRVFESVVTPAEAREMTRKYRVTARVRVGESIHLRGVAAPGEPVPGVLTDPSLEEAYLGEIDLANRAAGIERKRHFAFLYRTA